MHSSNQVEKGLLEDKHPVYNVLYELSSSLLRSAILGALHVGPSRWIPTSVAAGTANPAFQEFRRVLNLSPTWLMQKKLLHRTPNRVEVHRFGVSTHKTIIRFLIQKTLDSLDYSTLDPYSDFGRTPCIKSESRDLMAIELLGPYCPLPQAPL